VRRQPLAERLPRDRPRESHADPLPRAQDERRDGLRGAPLHLAGRRALRPPGQAAGERRVPGLRPLRGRAAGQRVPPHRQPSHRDALPRLPRRSPPGRPARASTPPCPHEHRNRLRHRRPAGQGHPGFSPRPSRSRWRPTSPPPSRRTACWWPRPAPAPARPTPTWCRRC
jgi:hypothetical protein